MSVGDSVVTQVSESGWCGCWKRSLDLQAIPGNLISGPKWLDEVEFCSDFEKNFEVFRGGLNLGSTHTPMRVFKGFMVLERKNLHRCYH